MHTYQCNTCGLIGGIPPQDRLQAGKCVACGGTELHRLAVVSYLVPVKHGACDTCEHPAEYADESGSVVMCSVHAAEAASEGNDIEKLD